MRALHFAVTMLLNLPARPLAQAQVAHAPPAAPAPQPERWQTLFDGRTLRGWDTWLGPPQGSPQAPPIGLNHDPDHVFSVSRLDGAPAIHVSGAWFGTLTTRAEFGDFHLRLQFKWGERKWPPRDQAPRDSGVLYRAVGPQGPPPDHVWMTSLECQVQEHDVGDLWAVAGARADVEGVSVSVGKNELAVQHQSGAPALPVAFALPHHHAKRSVDAEKPHGEWNTVEVMCVGDTCRHIVNGQTVLTLKNPRVVRADGSFVPLRRGRLQLQSEGAEVYFRAVEILPLAALPREAAGPPLP